MSPRTPGRPGRRALIALPAIAVPAAIVAAVLVPMSAAGAVDLPDKTPAELVEFAQASDVDQFSGTVEQTSALGLPDLGALAPGGDDADDSATADTADVDDLLALATGSYSARIYVDGDRGRLQVLDSLAERNIYLDVASREGWFVDSESQTATRLTLAEGADVERPQPPSDAAVPSPQAMLDDAIAALDETTEITVGTDARVAGREVYELILTPRTDDTLVGSIRFAVDGENGAALAASVTARGEDEPAFELAFSAVSFSAPDAADLSFEPGPDTVVAERELPLPSASDAAMWRAEKPAGAEPTVFGEGWSSVVELPSKDGTSILDRIDEEQRALLDTVTTAVDGGRVLETSLVTVLFADDGRVLVGAVPADRLAEAAASGR